MTAVGAAGNLVVLGRRAAGPANVLVHPAGGGLGQYIGLATRLGKRGPVFGIRASGLRERETPDDSVDAMTARYLSALKNAPRPVGLLAGWSLGGILAWELAVRLAVTRQAPAVVMIDSLAAASPVQRVGREVLHATVLRDILPTADTAARERAANTADAHLAAACRHRVRSVHPGPALLLLCAGEDRAGQAELWASRCPQLRVRQIPGGHFDVFSAEVFPIVLHHLDDFLSGLDS